MNSTYENFFGNDSDNSSYNDLEVKTGQSMRVFLLILYSLICALGVLGNAFVIWIAGFKMTRTVNTVWFLNLAVADFFVCILLAFNMVHLRLGHHWKKGNFICKFQPGFNVINMYTSVFTLVLISLDRFVLVVRPIWAQTHRRVSCAWMFCALAWLLALLLSLPSFIYKDIVIHEDNRRTCAYPSDSVRQSVYLPRLILGFLVPLLIIGICYLLIVRKVSTRRLKSQKTKKIIFGVVVAFFVCWLPFHVVRLVRLYGAVRAGKTVYLLVMALVYLNSCLNPVLYVFIGQDFRAKVKFSMRKVFENAFREDTAPRPTVGSDGLVAVSSSRVIDFSKF